MHALEQPASSSATAPISTLPAWPWGPFDREAPLTLGWQIAHWTETLLVQPNGPRAKMPFRFTRDQLRFILWWYALDADGQWLFFHGVRRLAKGSGKSPFGAVLGLIELCCPHVRLWRKDDRVPGGVVGRGVDLPWVQLAATAESQTENTMRMVRAFAPKGSAVVEDYGLDPGLTKYHRVPAGLLERITSSVAAAEGAETSLVLADQTELWRPGNGGTELMATLEDNLAKSVAEATWDAFGAQEEGRLRDGAGRILYDARVAAGDVNLSDEAELYAALEFIYGDCEWKRGADGELELTPIVRKIWSPKSSPSESRRKYLNLPTVATDAWVAPAEWTRGARPRALDPDEPVVLFFDGSKSRDATALIGCAVEDGYVFVPTWPGGRCVWEPDPTHDTADVVPVVEVDLAVRYVLDELHVVAFFADVQEWESFVKVSWPEAFGAELELDATDTGKDPQQIAWDMRTRTFEFTRAVELMHEEIEAGLVPHDGDPVLARHVSNCRMKPNRYGVSIGKDSPSSPKKIDAAVCAVGARMVRRLYLASKPKKKRSGVVM
jgi:hypothetical protein